MKNKELTGMIEELKFWEEFVKTNRFLQGWLGPGKTPELNNFVANFILVHPHEKVLDVGSGAVSILNGLINREKITAIDPLAELYADIFDYKSFDIVQPISIGGEEITDDCKFDIVHISNALDHSQDPTKVYQNLYRACKSGGFIVIQGFENEGATMGYQGMHQWNLFVNGMDLCGVNPLVEAATVIAHSNFMLAQREITEQGRDWFIWITQKL